MTMTISEIGTCFTEEMASLGKSIVPNGPISKREITYLCSPAPPQNEDQPFIPLITSNIRKDRAGWVQDLSFWIENADIDIGAGLERIKLNMHAGNWPNSPSGFSSEPLYVSRAAKITNEWIDRFVAAVQVAHTTTPWKAETVIMDRKLWMWLPIGRVIPPASQGVAAIRPCNRDTL